MQISNERDGRRRQRAKVGNSWAVSRQEFSPTELASLEGAKRVGERDTKAVTEQAGFGSRIVHEFRQDDQGGLQYKVEQWAVNGCEQ